MNDTIRLTALHCKDAVPKDLCHLLTHVMLRRWAMEGPRGDSQVGTAMAVMPHDMYLETIQERLWPIVETILGEELLPTYTYSRLYSNGDVLNRHTDRPACEVSLTVQLGRSHHYAWPIYMGNQRFDMAEGDAVIYSGCDVLHWRNECKGPDGYYSGQAFFHFVRKNGEHANEAGDSSKRTLPPMAFAKFRAHTMDTK